MRQCFSCNNVINYDGKPARGDTCLSCSADVKVCLNCEFFDEGTYNECHETQAERIVEKDASNFCEFFSFNDSVEEKTKEEFDNLEDLKDLFNDSD